VGDYVVEGFLDEETPENGLVTDLVSNAMSQVNWRELAEHVEDLLQYEMEVA
jgi:hypothetical protein